MNYYLEAFIQFVSLWTTTTYQEIKVTVGDFRTRDEAQRFASKLTNSGAYRYVFVVKEQINYPVF